MQDSVTKEIKFMTLFALFLCYKCYDFFENNVCDHKSCLRYIFDINYFFYFSTIYGGIELVMILMPAIIL